MRRSPTALAPPVNTAAVTSLDRFGNPFAPTLPYARGRILGSTEDDFRKLQQAWRVIRRHGPKSIFVFTGLEHGLPIQPEDLWLADDEFAPAVLGDRLHELALNHLGGSPDRHDAVVFNRLTAATVATHLALVKPGQTVIGISPTYSHPSIVRAVALAGARFVDTTDVDDFAEALRLEPNVGLVDLTRLAVSYELMPLDAIRRVVDLARERDVPVYIDDAGGARVGPAAFNQPKMLELGVDVGATGLDKYGTIGPRFGLLAGQSDLVRRIRAKAFEYGLEARPMLYAAVVRTLEQYRPERVQELIQTTRKATVALRRVLGQHIRETPTTGQLPGDDVLEIALARGGIDRPSVVPYEAAAALCMLLLRDHRILTVHFVGMPPGTANVLFKFIPPETLATFGGEDAFALAVDASLTALGALVGDPRQMRALLLGD
jgi:L-seryl-tRNA(Ser) seleniumtransferase